MGDYPSGRVRLCKMQSIPLRDLVYLPRRFTSTTGSTSPRLYARTDVLLLQYVCICRRVRRALRGVVASRQSLRLRLRCDVRRTTTAYRRVPTLREARSDIVASATTSHTVPRLFARFSYEQRARAHRLSYEVPPATRYGVATSTS